MKPLLLLLIALCLWSCGEKSVDPKVEPEPEASALNIGPRVGTQFPTYSATTLEGKPFALPDKSGRVLLLNLWATWCGPCRQEIPELIKLQRQHGPEKFDVVGISIDNADAVAEVREFVREQRINYPIVLDPAGRIVSLMQSPVLPTSVLLDRSGNVVWVHIGVVDTKNSHLNAALRRVL